MRSKFGGETREKWTWCMRTADKDRKRSSVRLLSGGWPADQSVALWSLTRRQENIPHQGLSVCHENIFLVHYYDDVLMVDSRCFRDGTTSRGQVAKEWTSVCIMLIQTAVVSFLLSFNWSETGTWPVEPQWAGYHQILTLLIIRVCKAISLHTEEYDRRR